MGDRRLSIALQGAGLHPEGRIAVFSPTADSDLRALPKDRSLLVQGFRPEHDALAAQGFGVAAIADGTFGTAVVFLPRSRAEGRGLIAEAAARVVPGGPVWIDGQKTDGIDSMLRDLRDRVTVSDPFSKAHGKCAMFMSPGAQAFVGWQAHATSPAPGFTALPGCFSADAVDPGSALLAAAMPDIKGRVADIGAGWGWLSAQVLRSPKVTEVHLIEAQYGALESARLNVADPRARFHWADATAITGLPRIETVVMNPPFHRGRTGDPGLGEAFIKAAARILAPPGVLWMVANQHLPYEQALNLLFTDVSEVARNGGFKVFRASRPVSSGRGTAPGMRQFPARPGG